MNFLIILFFISFVSNVEAYNLEDLSKILLSENPKIQSMEREVKMKELKVVSSSSLDDPKLKIGINSLPVDTWSFKDEDMTTKEIGISQMIPLGGKLKTKENIAYKELLIAKENLRKEKINMLFELEKNYYELAYIRSSIKILENIKSYLKLLIDSESALIKAGMGNVSNVVKVSVEEKMIDEEIINLRQKEREYLKSIGYIIGMENFSVETDELVWKPLEYNINELKDKAFSNNPDLRLLSLENELSNEEVDLKKKEYYPDLELSISYMQRDNSKDGMKRPDMVSAMAVFNIPLWFKKKNIPMIEEMMKKKEMVNKRFEDKKNEIISKIDTMIGEAERIKSLKSLYEDTLIPQNELILETYFTRYKTSNIEFMPVIDTIRTLLRYKKELESLKKELIVTNLSINTLIGNNDLVEK